MYFNAEAKDGSEIMKRLMRALEDINQAASHIANVIKIIVIHKQPL